MQAEECMYHAEYTGLVIGSDVTSMITMCAHSRVGRALCIIMPLSIWVCMDCKTFCERFALKNIKSGLQLVLFALRICHVILH